MSKKQSAQSDEEINIIDLFCGAGGFSHGFHLSNKEADTKFRILAGLDSNKKAIKTFETNHKEATGISGDISEKDPNEFEGEANIQKNNIDIVIGGPPCKGFSSIRPQRSSNKTDYRNYLYQDYLNYVEYFEPDMFIMENVPEIIQHTTGKGEDVLEKIEDRAEELGYENFEWKILNAVFYGVPQTRSRFVLIGAKDSSIDIEFPEPTHKVTDEEVLSRIKRKEKTKMPSSTEEESLKEAVEIEDAFKCLPKIEPGEESTEYSEDNAPNEYVGKVKGDKLTKHIATDHSDRIIRVIEAAGTTRSDLKDNLDDMDDMPSSGYSTTYSRQYRNQPAVVLTTSYTTAGSTRAIHPWEDRCLTPREGARIQSFPDDFKFPCSKTAMTTQVGNAVPPLLGKAIASKVRELYTDR